MSQSSSPVLAEALREKYKALREVVAAAGIGEMFVDDIRAPVPYISTLRLIAREEGIRTVEDLVGRAAELGRVAYDIDPGVTLTRCIEYVLKPKPTPFHHRSVPLAIPEKAQEGDDVRDAFDDLYDAVERLQNKLEQYRVQEWVLVAINEHVARMNGPIRPADPEIAAAACTKLAARSLNRLSDALGNGDSPYFADIGDALSLFGERLARLAAGRLGLHLSHPLTLEEVGQREGVTRERVRQLLVRFERRAVGWRPPLASLAILQAAIRESGQIVTGFELCGRLPEPLRPTPEVLALLPGLLSWGWLQGLVPSRFDNVWIRSSPDAVILEETVLKLRSSARRSINRWGALPLSEYEDIAGADGPGLAYSLIGGGQPTQMLDGWAILLDRQTTVVSDRARRIMAVTRSLSLPRLRRALKRSLRRVAPDSVLIAILSRDLDAVDLLGNGIVILGGVASRLSGAESLARELIEESGGLLSLRELQRGFVQRGMSVGSASIAYSRSVILERMARGVVGLIGTSPEPSRLLEVRKKLKRDSARSLVGYRHVTDGIELIYKLDRSLLSSTLFVIPKRLIDPGKWKLEQHSGSVVVKGGYITGLHGVAKTFVNGGARQVAVTFSSETKKVRVAPR